MKKGLTRTNRVSLFLLFSFSFLLLTSCNRGPKVEFRRFDRMLFTSTASTMASHRAEYESELINFYPDDTVYMQELMDFVNDTVVRYVYRVSDSM